VGVQVLPLGLVDLEAPWAGTAAAQGANLNRTAQAPFVRLQFFGEDLQISSSTRHLLSVALV
jgi:hypothetical protein